MEDLYIITREILVKGIVLYENRAIEINKFNIVLSKNNKSSGNIPNIIITEVKAIDEESAIDQANEIFNKFIISLPFYQYNNDNITAQLPEDGNMTIQNLRVKTLTNFQQITGKCCIAITGNELLERINKLNWQEKENFVPILDYSSAFYTNNIFQKYLYYYRVLEYYFDNSIELQKWILDKEPNAKMVRDDHKRKITIFQSIRHGISHPKLNKEQRVLTEINNQDKELIEDYLSDIKWLARKIIKEKEDL